uniref:CFAP65 fourth Ig-like domain-containing protein n=1 Tax=Sinocyclocheilus grahami TaxID=75366 RepID=A0A672KJU5_SINGR
MSGSPLKSTQNCFFGVETWAELVWEGWEPGNHCSLKICMYSSFSPCSFQCEYADAIAFQGKAGTFQVSLRAVTPHHALEVPDTVMLPPCAAHAETCECTVCVPSKLQTGFKWFVDPQFQLSPETGQLKPGEECRVTVEFKLQQALVYQTEASSAFGDDWESSCAVLLRGLLDSISVDYLSLTSFQTSAQVAHNVQIINSSAVLAHYQFDVITGSHSVFSIDKPCGSLPGSSKLTLRVKFCPHQPIAYHKTVICLLLMNLLRGLTCYPPDILSALLDEHKLKLDDSGALLIQEVCVCPSAL